MVRCTRVALLCVWGTNHAGRENDTITEVFCTCLQFQFEFQMHALKKNSNWRLLLFGCLFDYRLGRSGPVSWSESLKAFLLLVLRYQKNDTVSLRNLDKKENEKSTEIGMGKDKFDGF